MKTMIPSIKAGLLVSAVAALAGCTSASGPTFNAWTLNRPNGERAYRVECYGVFEGPRTCQRKAQEICEQQPVRILQAMEPYKKGDDQKPDTRELTFACGAAPVVAAVASPAAPPAPQPATERTITVTGDSNFDFNQAALTPGGRDRLNKLVSDAAGVTFTTVMVSGYTDGVGSVAYNQDLSERRARAVANYLKVQGLKAGQFVARGYGKSDPVASNATADGRARNRRVEIILNSGS
ncbi:OmpA family protein [Burkholderia cepacia]|uniref:OmpA family protein n=1 Tax=Burkholderia cepacia TaxID=292 RepID=UPI00265101B8|nr:OmpA family protein [Burkholderia cepacia]MDN7638825.1 OmpA family protein [Burkholderia cepacia]